MASRFSFFFLLSLLVNTLLLIHAQNISTTTPVPPLQWINLSNLLQGSTRPPPLRDAALGYDENSRSLIIFGGISEGGFPQSQTFLLNLQTLSWSTPSPPATLKGTPPARSAVVSGSDFAASNRHGFIVIGGKGSDGKALSDVWEYDFINQFWSQVALSSGGPSARWGASGGIDIRVPPVSDPILPGPNNTFYLTGGFDGSTADSLSDVWSLKLSGTLSSNLPNSVSGSWDHVNIGNMPGRVDQAGTVVLQQIVATGGCDANISPTTSNTTCAKQDSFIINVQSQTNASPGSCPAPRVGPVLVPNLNGFSTAFASQVFVMLGTFNASLWQDSNGLARGEVAILDINTGIWTRTIPSGDPGSSVQFPSPREGATAISFSQALVGDSRNNSADTIIFGGQDLNGTFLSDVWLLRAYSGIVTASSPGFGNGQLQTGINADGSGVHVDFLAECASFISQPSPTHVSSPSSTTTSPPSSGSISPTPPTPQAPRSFDTSFSHKLLLPLSLVISLPVFLFFRWTQMTLEEGWIPNRHIVLLSLATIVGIAAYGVGIAGFVLSFTTISSPSSKRNLHLKTAHGIVGLLFFLCLYAVVPLIYLVFACFGLSISGDSQSRRSENGLSNSIATNEKLESIPLQPQSHTPSLQNTTPPSSPRPRAMSWDTSMALQRPSNDGGMSSESAPSPTPHKGFEVLNRGHRARKLSGPWQASSVSEAPQRLPSTRRLGDIDWLLRRRRLNAVGELDYAITQAHNARYFADANGEPRSPTELGPMTKYPTGWLMVFHIVIQGSILGLSAVILSALWLRARRSLFAIFLVWILAYYACMLILAWNKRPASSLLTATLWRLRGKSMYTTPVSSTLQNSNSDTIPQSAQGPYAHHRPPFRASTQLDDLSYHGSPLSVASDENDGDEVDEETRQRLIEEEMERRDVSIVTVPRRKLYLTNPS